MKIETFFQPDEDQITIVIKMQGVEPLNWDIIRQTVERDLPQK